MMFKRVSTLLSACALAGLMVTLTGTTASAAPIVSFSTTGSFNGGGSSITFTDGDGGTATLSFFGTPVNGADTPSNANYGDLQLSTTGEFNGNIAGTTFELTVTQTAPDGGAGQFSGSLTGTIATIDQTNFILQFGPTEADRTIVIAGPTATVTYTVDPFVRIPHPTSGSSGGAIPGNTTIEGYITADLQQTEVPEPATMMLLGTGLLAAFRARRKVA